MGERLLTKLRSRLDQWGLNPVCEKVDHPGAVKCGRPADASITNPCGHDAFVCDLHLQQARDAQGWVCPSCDKASTRFKVWVPKSARV